MTCAPSQVLADALTEIMEKGFVKAVGVCNYDLKQLTQLNEILSKRGIPLASNQVSNMSPTTTHFRPPA